MDAERFDALTRLIGSRTSRRIAVGLVAAGLLTIVVPEAEALRCSKTKPCPECQRCRRRRCKPDMTKNGTPCAGDTGTCAEGVCGDCGKPGAFCCLGAYCRAGAICIGFPHSCQPCGDDGQWCCDPDFCTEGECTAEGKCGSCGGRGELCCFRTICDVGLTCRLTDFRCINPP